MNIEEAKRKLHNMAYRDLQTKPYDLKLADVIQILNQIKLDQLKPEVPQFVADWLDKCDREFKNLTYIFGNDCPKEVKEWCAVCGNHQKMLRALLYGYKVVDTEKVWFPVKKYFHDSVNKPSHYQGEYGLEAIAVIDNFMGDLAGKASWAWGNMIKYVLRFQKKNGLEDLKKARKNLDWLIEEMEKNNG